MRQPAARDPSKTAASGHTTSKTASRALRRHAQARALRLELSGIKHPRARVALREGSGWFRWMPCERAPYMCRVNHTLLRMTGRGTYRQLPSCCSRISCMHYTALGVRGQGVCAKRLNWLDKRVFYGSETILASSQPARKTMKYNALFFLLWLLFLHFISSANNRCARRYSLSELSGFGKTIKVAALLRICTAIAECKLN